MERDVRALIDLKDLRLFQHFLILLAGRIGQVINYASLSNDVGVSGKDRYRLHEKIEAIPLTNCVVLKETGIELRR